MQSRTRTAKIPG